MGRREYRKIIIDGLAGYAAWEEDIDYELNEGDTGDFFAMMVELMREQLAMKEPQHSVAKAFLEAQLSPNDPFNWLRLLEMFADAHYGRKPTKPTAYSPEFRNDLWKHLKTAIGKQSKMNIAAALREVVTYYPEYIREKEKSTEAVLRLQSAIKDFGWTKSSFENPSPPRAEYGAIRTD